MKIKYFTKLYKNSILLLCLFFIQNVFSQNEFSNKNIDSSFINFAKLYQEVVHTHFNKTTYIKGETIGFTSYVVNKKNNTPSLATKNLYCVITNDKNEVIKNKLLKVENGIASNVFEIDSSFSSGNYIFKTYTNWMLNFKQQNYFQEKFRVIDSEKDTFLKKTKLNSKIDIQFLPEGGHLIDNVMTTMGVIAKDNLGNGISNLKGKVFDDKNVLITSFELNNLGIGRFSFIPKAGKTYTTELLHNQKKQTIKINTKIKLRGVNLKIDRRQKDILISVTTNKNTLKNIKNTAFVVTNYNTYKLEKIPFRFSDKTTITKKIALNKIMSGLSVFTLFDSKNNPISERLFFNYQNISFKKSDAHKIGKKENDSLTVYLSYKKLKAFENNNVSVSVLPAKTTSYNKNSHIVSQTLIQPYINGQIEKGAYYFTDINAKKKYDLDNLLLTQGWSSYDWNDIFKDKINLKYAFEEGINLKINFPKKKKEKKFLFHHSFNKLSHVIEVKKEVGSFNASGYYPLENQELHVSELNKKGKLSPASLYIQYLPDHIPTLDTGTKNLLLKPDYYTSENYIDGKIISESLKNTQKLDEIVFKVDFEKERMEKIEAKAKGNVYFFDDDSGFNFNNIFVFFRTKGFIAERVPGSDEIFLVNNQVNTSLNGGYAPLVFLNDLPLLSLNQLNFINFNTIDYIDINKSGTGEGIRGAGGVIRIYTDPFKSNAIDRTTTKSFEFPLTFSKTKQFYTPIYQSYDSNFYRKYGTIDWLPKNKINENGTLTIKFKNKQPNNVTLFIEGITNEGEFIFEEKILFLE